MKTDRKKAKRGITLSNLENLQTGEVFYSEMKPKSITAYSAIYQKKVSTEVCLVMSDYRTIEPKIKRITKVTIL